MPELQDVVEKMESEEEVMSRGVNTLIGKIHEEEFKILIDSGSTRNLINPATAQKLGLPMQAITGFRVVIGNGEYLVCKHVCRNVQISMQDNVDFEVDLYILPTDVTDVVLGIEWLQKLGRVTHDYVSKTMEFEWRGEKVVTLKAERTRHLAVSQPLLDALRIQNTTDSELTKLHQQFKANELNCDYSVKDGIMMFRKRRLLAKNSPLKHKVMMEFHAHDGITRTLLRISSLFYWSNIRKDIEQFIASCPTCQQQPLPKPSLVWDQLTMDFITGLPKSEGQSVILIFVDRLTKAAHFGALPPNFTALETSKLFLDMVVKNHGFPSSIVSDRDPVFLSTFQKKTFELGGTTLHHSSVHHPQTEAVDCGIKDYLRSLTQEKPQNWVSLLPLAELIYNTSYNSSIQKTPYEAVFGRPPPIVTNKRILRLLKENLEHANKRITRRIQLQIQDHLNLQDE